MKNYKKVLLFVLLLSLVTLTGCAKEVFDERGYYVEENLDYVELSLAEQELKDVKNLIFVIADGMGFNHVEVAKMKLASDSVLLDIQKMPYKSEVITLNINGEITDSAASATAYATGFKTANGNIGRSTEGEDYLNILEYAKEKGYATGIITSETLYDATGAAFSAHVGSRYSDDIPLQQINAGVDIMIGGGRVNFEEHKDLIVSKGYEYINTIEDFRATKAEKLFVIPTTTNFMNNANTPSLAEFVQKTIEILSKNETGFILIVEEGLVDGYSHSNNMSATINKMEELDKALRVTLNFARSNHDTLVVLTADHETGGIILGEGAPDNSWFSIGNHTANNVPLYAFGLKSYLFDDKILDNTDVNKIMVSAMGFNDFPSIAE